MHDSLLPKEIVISDEAEEQEKRDRIFRIRTTIEPLMRIIGVLLVTILAAIHRLSGYTSFDWPIIIGFSVAVLIIHCLGSWLLLRRYLFQWPYLYDVVSLLDFALMTVGIYFTGGESSLLFFIYLTRVADQIAANYRRVLYFSLLAPAFYAAMLIFIQEIDARAINWKMETIKMVSVFGAGMYLMFIARYVGILKNKMTSFLRAAKNAYRLSESRKTELEEINAIVQSINLEMDFGQLLEAILEETKKIIGAAEAFVFVYSPQTDLFQAKSTSAKDAALTLDEITKKYIQPAKEVLSEIFVLEDTVTMKIQLDQRIEGFFVYIHAEAAESEALHVFYDLKEHIKSAFIKTKLLEELKKLNDKKNEFLGIAAHDLRNPLGAISGFIELLIYDIKENRFELKKGVEDLERVLSVTRKMVRLITDLLDISIIESGNIKLDLHRVKVDEILEDTEQFHKRSALQKNINLIVEKSEGPYVLADRFRIEEVLDNLLSNAIKYTFSGGEVRVFCQVELAEVVTNIQDTGQGLTEEDLRTIFTNYGRLSAQPTSGETSTGLGLAIVKKIVEMHGGRVWVRSEKGKGSIFSFSLPIWTDDGQAS